MQKISRLVETCLTDVSFRSSGEPSSDHTLLYGKNGFGHILRGLYPAQVVCRVTGGAEFDVLSWEKWKNFVRFLINTSHVPKIYNHTY